MDDGSNREGNRDPRWVYAFHILLLIYPLLGFAWRRSYPVSSSEMLGLALVLAALGAGAAWLHLRLKPGVSGVLSGFLVCLVVMVQFNPGATLLAVVVAGLAVVVTWAGPKLYAFGAPVVAAMILGAFLEGSAHPDDFLTEPAGQPAQAGLPPVVHIILDGFIGTGGLPAIEPSQVFTREVDEFAREFGFVHFPNAYSRFPVTGDSIYAAFNFTDVPDSRFTLETLNREKHRLAENAWIGGAAEQGYRFNFYQTSHLDFCRASPPSTDRCWNYMHPNVHSIRALESTPGRMWKIARVILFQSGLLQSAAGKMLGDPSIAVHDPAALDTLGADLLSNPGGRVFLAHLLIPHSPFVYLNDCTVSYEDNPAMAVASRFDETDRDPQFLYYRTLRYFEQAECALNSLRGLFAQMRESGLFDRSLIILHGDHGSTISAWYPVALNLQQLTIDDLRAHYSTFFAVKLPGGEFEERAESLPLSALMRSVSAVIGNPGPGNAQILDREIGDRAMDTPSHVFIRDGVGHVRVDIDLFAEPAATSGQ